MILTFIEQWRNMMRCYEQAAQDIDSCVTVSIQTGGFGWVWVNVKISMLVSLLLDLCRSTNRRFSAFIAGFVSQYKPAVRCLYSWICLAVQTGGSVLWQLGLCRSTNRRFIAFTARFLSQYKPAVQCHYSRFLSYIPAVHCLYNWVSLPFETDSQMPLDFGSCPNKSERFNASTV
jgi:hypothetical protein